METIRVTTTLDGVLRHAIELTEPREGEDVWHRQARGLDEIGYTILGKDDAAELDRLRAVEKRARDMCETDRGLGGWKVAAHYILTGDRPA